MRLNETTVVEYCRWPCTLMSSFGYLLPNRRSMNRGRLLGDSGQSAQVRRLSPYERKGLRSVYIDAF